MGPKKRLCGAKKRQLQVVTSFAKAIQLGIMFENLCFSDDDCLFLTFHGQRHVFQVRHQPPCSDGLSCLGSHGSLHNRTGASFEVEVARFQIVLPSCALYLADLRKYLYNQRPWSEWVPNRDCVVLKSDSCR